jgi:hypothetical protein
MERRNFLSGAMISALALLMSTEESGLSQVSARTTNNNPFSGEDIFQLTSVYGRSSGAVFTSGGHPPLPSDLLYLYYDDQHERFIDPTQLSPGQDPGKYTLSVDLLAYHLASGSHLSAVDKSKDLQLTLQVAAPQNPDGSKTLSWLLMNAIDVFGDRSDVQKRLTRFQTETSVSNSFSNLSNVDVPVGFLELQVVALAQRKKGFWTQLFSVLSKASAAPILGSIGLPALVPEVLAFVNTSLNILGKQTETLIPIWQTKRLPFGIFKGTNAKYKFNPGFWVMIDRSYAAGTSMLKGHRLDIKTQSLAPINEKDEPVDANYLVTHCALTRSIN